MSHESHIDRALVPLVIALAGHLAVGCCLMAPGGEKKGGREEEAGGEGASPARPAAPAKAARRAAPVARAPLRATGPGGAPTEAELLQSIGGKDSGWLPLAAQDLRKGMTPAEVDRLFPGAAALDQFEFSRSAAAGVPGAKEIKFQFLGRHGLRQVQIVWDKGLTKAPGFWERLVKVCSAKYDEVKPRDVDKEFGFITWGYSRTAQIAKTPEPGGGEAVQLSVQL